MQVLKEEIKEKIMNSAIEEFSAKGFLGASMRNIAQKASVTVGNIYRYFESKEILFDHLLSPVALELVNTVEYSDALDPDDMVMHLVEVYSRYPGRLNLLIWKSHGSRYEGTKQQITKIIENRVVYSKAAIEETEAVYDNDFAQVVSATLVEGIFTVFRDYDGNLDVIRRLLYRLLILFLNAVGFSSEYDTVEQSE